MSKGLYDQLIEYFEQFRGEGPFGISVRKIKEGRIGNVKEENGCITFSMERHKPLYMGYSPGDSMKVRIIIEEKYIFSTAPKEHIDIIESNAIDFVATDLDTIIREELDKDHLTIIKRDDEYILESFESGEICSEKDKESLKATYLENSKSEIEFYINDLFIVLDDAILEFPTLKDKIVSYKNETTLESVYNNLLDDYEYAFDNATEIDEDGDEVEDF